jgi:adenylosuccinate synthase
MKEKKQLINVTDLGGGDGGKGGVVHKLCTLPYAHTVIKVGGAQGSHGVRTTRGETFNFSQLGCGTFEGVDTYISPLMIIEPYRLLDEARTLQFQWGIRNIFSMVTVDSEALCITPFHGIASKLRELARGTNQKGTVGIGGGECLRDSEERPELAIRAGDCLNRTSVQQKLREIQLLKREQLQEALGVIQTFNVFDREIANQQVALLYDDSFPQRIAKEFQLFAKSFAIVDRDYLQSHILKKDGTVIVESSHGILTDRYAGFHPHTSFLRTLPQITIDMIKDCNYSGSITKLGITRGYQIRHGAGPLVTESEKMVSQLLPGSNKDENRWQGKVRVGPLDLVALRYAIEVSGGASFYDGLAITWFDQIELMKEWHVAVHYHGSPNPEFFKEDGDIKPYLGPIETCFPRQEKLGELLMTRTPEIVKHDIAGMTQSSLAMFCKEYLTEKLHVAPKMISFGATEDKKLLL